MKEIGYLQGFALLCSRFHIRTIKVSRTSKLPYYETKVPLRFYAPLSLSYGPVCPLECRFTVEKGLDWDEVSSFGKLFPCKETHTGVEEIENNASPEYRAKMPW